MHEVTYRWCSRALRSASAYRDCTAVPCCPEVAEHLSGRMSAVSGHIDRYLCYSATDEANEIIELAASDLISVIGNEFKETQLPSVGVARGASSCDASRVSCGPLHRQPNQKACLRGRGVVAHRRYNYGYRCGSCLATNANPAPSLVRPAPKQITSPDISVRRAKALSFSGCESHPATFAPAGSNRSSRGGNEAAEASGVESSARNLASMQPVIPPG